jgi:hypothetical protein
MNLVIKTLLVVCVVSFQVAEAAGKYAYRVACSKLDKSAREIEILSAPESREVEEIKLNYYKILGPYEHRGEPVLFFRVKGSEEKPMPIQLGTAKKSILVFMPSSDSAQKYRVKVVSEENFRGGSVYFWNDTSVPIGAMISGQKVLCKPGRGALWENKNSNNVQNVQIAFHHEESWKKMSSTRWNIRPNQRHMVFFFYNPKTKRIDYDSLTDTVSAKK